MSIKQINEGFRSRFENVLRESCSPSAKDELRAALEDAAFNLSSRQILQLKAYEIAFQDAIEKLYPDNMWWEITECNIYGDLLAYMDIDHTINEIINQLKVDTSIDESFNESKSINEHSLLKERDALKEDLEFKIIEEERVYLPTPDGKADIHVMLTCESFEDEVEYGIDIDWGSAAKLADKISKAIWKYSYGDDRYIHIGENYVEIPQKGFVESWCCWNDEDLDVIQELYDAIIKGLMNIDVPEDLEEAAKK